MPKPKLKKKPRQLLLPKSKTIRLVPRKMLKLIKKLKKKPKKLKRKKMMMPQQKKRKMLLKLKLNQL